MKIINKMSEEELVEATFDQNISPYTRVTKYCRRLHILSKKTSKEYLADVADEQSYLILCSDIFSIHDLDEHVDSLLRCRKIIDAHWPRLNARIDQRETFEKIGAEIERKNKRQFRAYCKDRARRHCRQDFIEHALVTKLKECANKFEQDELCVLVRRLIEARRHNEVFEDSVLNAYASASHRMVG